MATKSARDPEEAELSNDALVRRSQERLRLLDGDPEVAGARPDMDAIAAIQRCATTIETVAKAFELYADRACFEERAFEGSAGDGVRLLPELRTVSYRDVWKRVEAFASGLAHERLAAPGAFVGICGFGSVDWVVADFALLRLAAVSVPLQTNMSPADLEQIIREARLTCIVCGPSELDAIDAVLARCPSVTSLVVMDVRAGDRSAAAKVARRQRATEGPRVLTMAALEDRAREKGIVPMTLPSVRPEPDPLMTLVYTSGSTGTPKGAMVPESLYRELWQTGFSVRMLRKMPELPQITVSYMPLNHAAGRMTVTTAIVRGGLTSFVAKSDMSTLFEDIRLARPTMLLLVPRVAATIFQHYQGELVRRVPRGASESERVKVSGEIMAEMRRSFLGDRLLIAMTGTAPTPPEIVAFIKRCFDVPVVDGYGSTEAGPLTFDDRVDADLGLEWKLVDVPELGYRATDKPFPRGELHVKSRFVIPGYYENERATKQLFDDDGYLNTGDIVEARGPDRLVWIDRAKNVLKLSQGEFVATSRLEGLFSSQSPFIRQIYLYGNGLRSYLLAVVVPDVEAASAVLRERGIAPDDAALKALIRTDIDRIARAEHLRGHEVPRDFLLEREPFSVERGLLTDSNKQSRPRLQARYGARLEALYGALERAQVEELYALRGADGARGAVSVAERVKRAMGVTLGLSDLDVREAEQSFIQLGGDSLSAVGLEALIHDVTGVRVPVGLLLDPTSSVRGVVEYVEGALAGNERRAVTFAEIHGAGAKSIRASDLAIDKFLGAAELDAARAATPASSLPPRAEVALLTGANGFLGRFLALELCERLASERTKLYAVVRAPSDAAAFERLASSYRADPRLAERFEALAAGGRIAVLAGDLMKPRLGLAEGVYARLATEVDLVVHNGALVNHALGYEALFEPNVLGTVEVMRFALTRRIKSVSYVSTVGVMSGLERAVGEDEDVRALFREKPTASGYAAGYGASKWASEILLRDAHEELGLPVAVFRPSEIMAHQRYRGQVNVPDFFTRLLAGLIYTELAPRSFYDPAASDASRHYDGLPADVVARSIAAPSVSRAPREDGAARYETFNVVNPHDDDGISLDVIVHWVTTAGYPVRRVADYDTWFRMFHDRLASLPEPRRQHSPLAILDAWAAPQGARPLPRLDSTRLRERLAAIDAELASFPHVSEALIHKTLDDMATLRVIDRPLRMTG
ncbi:MAG: thioester reductase domain-containing protein [Labilithrix sp.]|nr:thioester reductase domain-containing protein [Labilithrix sp.]